MDDTIPIARPFVDVAEAQAIAAVLQSRWLTNGPKVQEFEQAFGKRVVAKNAVAVSSGTTALHLALVAAGVSPGDDVVCPSLSFIATANAIVHAGATPIFAEVNERTLNVTPESIAAALTSKTRAILVVHQVGMPADVDAIRQVAPRIAVVEDAACAVGSEVAGAPIGRPHGAVACFSFHPRKIITTGEGGMITTADDDVAQRLRRLRNHGALAVGQAYAEVGWNYRMTDLQAAMGIVQIKRLDELLERRRQLANRYLHLLGDCVDVPIEPANGRHSFQSYVVRLRGKDRDAVVRHLAARGIQTRPGVMASHLEPAYRSSGVSLPVTEELARETLALPMYHELSDRDQERVAQGLKAALAAC